MPTGVSRININHPVPSPSIVSSAAASTSTAALTTTLRKQNVASKRGVALVPRVAGVNELGQIADGASGAVAFLAVAAGAAGVSFASSAALEKRVEEAIAKAESYGIDLTDLYYDFDVPGDQYPFGDGEEWMPKSWKPPKSSLTAKVKTVTKPPRSSVTRRSSTKTPHAEASLTQNTSKH